MTARAIQRVIDEHADNIMSLPGVVGMAQGLCEDHPCIKVFVDRITPELEGKIPATLEGHRVVVEATGKFRALPGNNESDGH